VVGFSTTSEVLFVAEPGRQPLNFYLCIGKMTPEEQELPAKSNPVLGPVL
jgi:hypothetical protein